MTKRINLHFQGPHFDRWTSSLRVGARFFEITIERGPSSSDGAALVFDWRIVEGVKQEREIAGGEQRTFGLAANVAGTVLAMQLSGAERDEVEKILEAERQMGRIGGAVTTTTVNEGVEIESTFFSPVVSGLPNIGPVVIAAVVANKADLIETSYGVSLWALPWERVPQAEGWTPKGIVELASLTADVRALRLVKGETFEGAKRRACDALACIVSGAHYYETDEALRAGSFLF